MRLLDLLQAPEELEHVCPKDVPELLGELAAWESRIKMMLEKNDSNGGPSLRLLTSEEVAAMLNVKPYFVEERTRRHEIKCVRLSKYVRYRLEDVLDYIESHR